MNAAIQLQGIHKSYGKGKILRGLSFSIPRGVIGLYLGPNGAGKTTTFRLLTGLARADAGQIAVLGGPLRPELRRCVAAAIEEPRFYPHLSGLDNLRIVARMRRITARGWPAEALARVGLAGAAGRPFRTYSQGMRQRLHLAGCLAPNLQLLLLDEPTNGLDVEGRHELWAVLQGLRDSGVSVLVSTHQILETERYAEYVAVLHGGCCAFAGSLQALLQRRRVWLEVAGLEGGANLQAEFTALGFPTVQAARGGLWVSADQAAAVRAALSSRGLTVTHQRPEDLEEVYWRLKDAS